MTSFIIVCLAVPFIISFLCGFIVRKWAIRIGLIDDPKPSVLPVGENHKTHLYATPLGGGLAIYIAIAISIVGVLIISLYPESLACYLPPSLGKLLIVHAPGIQFSAGKPLFLLLICSILLILGLWDDCRNLGWKFRIVVQFLAAIATVIGGWRMSLFLGDSPAMVFLTGVISVFWIVGLINSFNMLDNMDGLSAGVGSICALFLAMFALSQPESGQQGQCFVGGLMLILAGSLLGFLGHNRPPAKLFMGDSGSYIIGYLLATGSLSAVFVGENAPVQSILAPLCIFAIPLYDTFSVIGLRLYHGVSPFQGDANHLSHRLVKMGLSRPRAVAAIYLMSFACSAGSIILPRTDIIGAGAVILIVLSITAIIGILEVAKQSK